MSTILTMKKLILLFLLFIPFEAILAQGGGPPNPPGPVDDVPAPINDFIWPLFLLALIYGLYLIVIRKIDYGKK